MAQLHVDQELPLLPWASRYVGVFPARSPHHTGLNLRAALQRRVTNSDQKESDALGQGPEMCLDGVHRISCLKAPFMMQEVNTLFQFPWDGSPGEVLKKKKNKTEHHDGADGERGGGCPI